MLVENSLSSSLETSLLNAPEYQDPFAPYDWVSLAETYQMIHKFPEQSQGSFLEAVPVSDAMNLDESKHPKLKVSCPEQSVMCKRSEKALNSLVYGRKKKSVKLGGTAEHNPQNNKKQDHSLDDSIVPVHNPGESAKRKNRFNNCLFYSRKRRRGESSRNIARETTVKIDGLDDACVSEHDCGKTKNRSTRLDNCLVYRRKKGRVKLNSCRFSEHVSGGTKISGDQANSSAYSQGERGVKADGAFPGINPVEIKNSGDHAACSRSKQLVKSNGNVTESHIGETKRNVNKADVLLTYSRRKQRVKSIGIRVNGFLVYSRKKSKVKSTNFSDGTSVEDEATNCVSSDAGVSKTDSDGSSSPFRECKHCHKPVTVGKMLICDRCEEAYHTSCCGIRMKEVAEIGDWLCPSCLKKKSSKTKTKRRLSRELKWSITEPIGIRIGKEFQADVPDWSGPTMSDTSFLGEPLVINQSEYMHDPKKTKNSKKLHGTLNWLQCREEASNGGICGKWRRAPRSEVQTKNWECFCCVSWDPSHADCAVPQELGTNEILKQLKYIKMLRPRSDAKRRQPGQKGHSRSHNKGKSS